METDIVLCSDLDRTLIPNGNQEESPLARPLLRRLAERPEIALVYVTGRDRQLIAEAIIEFGLPLPRYAIGDVGTSIYQVDGSPGDPRFSEWEEWQAEIGRDWHGWRHDDLAGLFADIEPLRLQEPLKQNAFKVSYYVDLAADWKLLVETIRRCLDEKGIRASIVTSVDEQEGVGLLDILPEGATKVDAIRFLTRRQGITEAKVVFAGDSGNDLPALTSGLQAILVKNAADEVRRDAMAGVAEKGIEDRLYMARGGFLEMNGNYSAGVLEGLAHFVPHAEVWMREARDALGNSIDGVR